MRYVHTGLALMLLSLFALADNPTYLGELPPALTFGAAANRTLPAEAVADLKGDVVFLVYYRTSCPGCIAILPGLQKTFEKHDRPDVHVIGLTNDSVGLTRRHLVHESAGRNLDIPIAVRSNGNYGVSGVPMGYLIGRDGKVLWAGHPNSGYAKDLAAAIAAPDPAISDAGRKVKKALGLVYRRQYVKALAAAGKLEGEAAAYVPARIAAYFDRRMAVADRHLARGDLHATARCLKAAIAEFEGTEQEPAAQEKLEELQARENFGDLRAEWKQLHDAWTMARTGKAPALKGAAARLRALVAESGDARLVKEAEALLAVVNTPWSLQDAAEFGGGCGVSGR